MKILILSKYTEKGASSRYRFYNYKFFFSRNNIEYHFAPLLPNRYIDKLYSGKSVLLKFIQLQAIFKRIIFIIRYRKAYDLIIIEKELFTNIPYFFEKILLFKVNYALDFDDYAGADYQTNFFKKIFLKNKIQKLVRRSVFTTVGNRWYFERFKTNNLSYLPTVIDITKYKEIYTFKLHNLKNKIKIVWIGSPSTIKYLKLIENPFKRLSQKYNVELVIIGGICPFNYPNVKNIKWEDKTEIENISIADIGIMPLHNSLWDKGKCGFKLIQYMACGLPVVASKAPANDEIVEHGVNGFIAKDENEWFLYLEKLISNDSLRYELGIKARSTIERKYTYQVWGDRYCELIKKYK